MSAKPNIMPPFKLKRIRRDIQMLSESPPDMVNTWVDDNDLNKVHFLFFGPKGTFYEGGEYIGEMNHTDNYPFTGPRYTMRTPSGRFEINQSICVDNSVFHPEKNSPEWSISGRLVGLLSVMAEDNDSGISHIVDKTGKLSESRLRMAKESIEYNMKHHSELYDHLKNDYLGKNKPVKKVEEKVDVDSSSDDTPSIKVSKKQVMAKAAKKKVVKKKNSSESESDDDQKSRKPAKKAVRRKAKSSSSSDSDSDSDSDSESDKKRKETKSSRAKKANRKKSSSSDSSSESSSSDDDDDKKPQRKTKKLSIC